MHALYLDDNAHSSLRRAPRERGIKLTCFNTADALLAIAPSSDAGAIPLEDDLGDTDGLTVFQTLRAKGVTPPASSTPARPRKKSATKRTRCSSLR